jgi:hypothetical protein
MKNGKIIIVLPILLIVILFAGYYLGATYGQKKVTEVKVDSQLSTSTEETNNVASSSNLFESVPQTDNTSNVVGYILGGAFELYVPNWVMDHWLLDTSKTYQVTVRPKDTSTARDFSNIEIYFATSTETYNAETLYSNQIKNDGKTICITNSRCESAEQSGNIITSEIILGDIGDTYIYHIARMTPDSMVTDYFYFDGQELTGEAIFSVNKSDYGTYGLKVRQFIQGIGKTITPQG